MAFRENGCTILFCSHSPYHIRHLCDSAIWLEGGRMRAMGPTEPVLGAYELHTRLRQQEADKAGAPTETVTAAVHPVDGSAPGTARIISLTLDNLGPGEPPLLQSADLVATIVVRGRGEERPNIGFMIEQSRGSGITSLATHEEGAHPVRLPDGNWRSVVTFPNLPLHSGEYVVSAFLFDESGLVVYDEWLQYLHFRFVSPTLMPGLVRLPHHWG